MTTNNHHCCFQAISAHLRGAKIYPQILQSKNYKCDVRYCTKQILQHSDDGSEGQWRYGDCKTSIKRQTDRHRKCSVADGTALSAHIPVLSLQCSVELKIFLTRLKPIYWRFVIVPTPWSIVGCQSSIRPCPFIQVSSPWIFRDLGKLNHQPICLQTSSQSWEMR